MAPLNISLEKIGTTKVCTGAVNMSPYTPLFSISLPFLSSSRSSVKTCFPIKSLYLLLDTA